MSEAKRKIVEYHANSIQALNRNLVEAFNVLEQENLIDAEKESRQTRLIDRARLELPKIRASYETSLYHALSKSGQEIHQHGSTERYYQEVENARAVKKLVPEYDRAYRIGDVAKMCALASEACERGDPEVISRHAESNPVFRQKQQEYASLKHAIENKKQKYEDVLALGDIVRPAVLSTKLTRSGAFHVYGLPSEAEKANSEKRTWDNRETSYRHSMDPTRPAEG